VSTSPEEISAKLSTRVGGALQRHTSRRGFISKASKMGAVLASGGLLNLVRAQPAYACSNFDDCHGPIDCPGCYCDDTCFGFGVSIFCCSIPGSSGNVCPSGTYRSGWWKCAISTSVCASGYRFYVDCNPTPGPGQCPCSCPNGCNGHPSCRFCREWFNCNDNVSLGRIKCRIARCKNPGQIWNDCDTAGGAESGGEGCNCNATCACA